LLGGEQGTKITIEKGDILVIPAGVAHKNIGKENDAGVVGAYLNARDYNMNYGKPGENDEDLGIIRCEKRLENGPHGTRIDRRDWQ
jgi:uncharacterized protein YjlB